MRKLILIFLVSLIQALGATYYIDFATGSDANNGTAKGTPWKHQPYMTGWTGSYTHSAGDQFIFKGGVTWDHTCWPMNVATGGGSGNRDYYGVDLTWYTGGSFSRPIFDGEYTSLNSHNVYVSAAHVKFDTIEMKRKQCSNVSTAPALLSWDGADGYVDNCYLHGWKTTSVTDDAYGGFVNGTASPAADLVMNNTEIENSENIGIQRSGVCVRCVAIIQGGSKIHDNSSGVLYCLDFNGSYLYNITGDGFDGTYHYNGVYQDPYAWSQAPRTAYIRNSYLHDVYLGANMAYPNVRGGATCVMYNNVLYGAMSAQLAVEIDPYQYGGEGAGTFTAYNNTIYNYSSGSVVFNVVTRADKLGILNLYNNHAINASGLTNSDASNTTTYNNGTNLSQSAATATSQGYVLGNLYAPTSTSGSTYNTGTSESGTFTTDILGITRPQASIWDIGAYEYNGGTPPTFTSQLSGKIILQGNFRVK